MKLKVVGREAGRIAKDFGMGGGRAGLPDVQSSSFWQIIDAELTFLHNGGTMAAYMPEIIFVRLFLGKLGIVNRFRWLSIEQKGSQVLLWSPFRGILESRKACRSRTIRNERRRRRQGTGGKRRV